jgi:hypothetical protein
MKPRVNNGQNGPSYLPTIQIEEIFDEILQTVKPNLAKYFGLLQHSMVLNETKSVHLSFKPNRMKERKELLLIAGTSAAN